jgi:hypothetical protein
MFVLFVSEWTASRRSHRSQRWRAADDAGAARRRASRIRLRAGPGTADTNLGTFTQALFDEAKQKGWTVISMKNDWRRIFAFE